MRKQENRADFHFDPGLPQGREKVIETLPATTCLPAPNPTRGKVQQGQL
jgi:hypothetical protein